MKKSLLTLITLILFSFSLFAQRGGRSNHVSYTSLVNRSLSPVFFLDEVLLPGKTDSTTTLALIFRMDNEFLPFKKINYETDLNQPAGYEFYSLARINSEIFRNKGEKSDKKNAVSVARDVWQDTVFAKTFDDTRLKTLYTSGVLVNELTPGSYDYLLQLNLMGEANDRNSTRRTLKIQNLSTKKTGEIYLVNTVATKDDKLELTLLNMGNNALYGKDFHALVRIPEYDETANYTLDILKATIGKKDTTLGKSVFNTPISTDNIYPNSTAKLLRSGEPTIELTQGVFSYTYAVIKIPNSTFENSVYQIQVRKVGVDEPIAKRIIRSYWPDMPPALYNIDIALDMLKFIISEKEVKELKKGNSAQKEAKFREFWASKDPTPGTEYNELMTEYYRRVDYAFKEFRNPENPEGQDTDRGSIYIKFGPPISTERQFPSMGRVLETWTYPDRVFVFEKGSGFSDFKLLGKE